MNEPIMVQRFQQQNWGDDRRTIHNLLAGQEVYFPVKGHNNIHNHVRRLNDAYAGVRQWKLERRDDCKVVTRLK